MRLYVRAEYAIAVALLRGKEGADERWAEIDRHNDEVAMAVFNIAEHGGVAYQKVYGGKRLDIYHVSTRPADSVVQVSRFCLVNGRWEAMSHGNCNTPKDVRKNLLTGGYVNMRCE